MPRYRLLLLIGALGCLLGGASCSEHGNDAPAPGVNGAARPAYQLVPMQQVQPRVQSLPQR